MDTITRRRFLLASGAAGGAAIAQGATAYSLRDILSTAGHRDPTAKTLVLVTLYGGNDGLNTVIPYADPAYAAARPALAYPADKVLRLDDAFGLNPAMTGLHDLFGANKLAIVRGVGYPRPNRSHFQSMDIWQSGRPDRPETTGWLGRWLDATGGDPRLAVSFEPVLPPLLAGAKSSGATVPGGTVRLPENAGLLRKLGAAAPGEPAAQARAAACFTDLTRIQDLMHDVTENTGEDTGDGAGEGATATGGAGQPLDAQLALVARCVEAGAATRVYSVSLGGFDLHADEKTAQESQLAKLDKALTAFARRMARTAGGRKVVIAVYSEFGRRVRANASDGTDHGTASSVFLLGEPVEGGLYGEPPSLTDLDQGDLKYTTDFRDVYATLLGDVLGGDPGRILNGWTGRLAGVHL
jgi:uncharacterized protein (DUF1501 family)